MVRATDRRAVGAARRRVAGEQPGAVAGRARATPAGKTWNALAPELSSGLAEEARRLALQVLAGVPEGEVLAVGHRRRLGGAARRVAATAPADGLRRPGGRRARRGRGAGRQRRRRAAAERAARRRGRPRRGRGGDRPAPPAPGRPRPAAGRPHRRRARAARDRGGPPAAPARRRRVARRRHRLPLHLRLAAPRLRRRLVGARGARLPHRGLADAGPPAAGVPRRRRGPHLRHACGSGTPRRSCAPTTRRRWPRSCTTRGPAPSGCACSRRPSRSRPRRSTCCCRGCASSAPPPWSRRPTAPSGSAAPTCSGPAAGGAAVPPGRSTARQAAQVQAVATAIRAGDRAESSRPASADDHHARPVPWPPCATRSRPAAPSSSATSTTTAPRGERVVDPRRLDGGRLVGVRPPRGRRTRVRGAPHHDGPAGVSRSV